MGWSRAKSIRAGAPVELPVSIAHDDHALAHDASLLDLLRAGKLGLSVLTSGAVPPASRVAAAGRFGAGREPASAPSLRAIGRSDRASGR